MKILISNANGPSFAKMLIVLCFSSEDEGEVVQGSMLGKWFKQLYCRQLETFVPLPSPASWGFNGRQLSTTSLLPLPAVPVARHSARSLSTST